MAVTVSITWKFPEKKFFFLKIEVFFVALLALLVFVLSFFQFESWFYSIVFTLVFLLLYVLSSYLIQKWREVEERYTLTKSHLEIIRKKKNKVKKEKVFLKDIIHHKLDKFFLGGYLLTNKKKKHLLFFNTKEEIEKFENFLKKLLEPKSKIIKKKE